ncbi:MAG: NmrA family NAD(P)-binding protein [Burkholderiales bacterium]|nr:NmrA family NAD(P)-binding protein [Burkholderiales bacterium]
MKGKAVILGSNGRLGRELVAAFSAAGWTTVAVARKAPLRAASRAAGGAAPVRDLRADVTDSEAIIRAVGRADVLVLAANAPYTRWTQDAMPIAQAAITLAQRLGATLLFPGNVYNFGEAMPAQLTVDMPQQPTTRKGRVRVEIEQTLARATLDGLRAVVIRAGDFIGGGKGNWFDGTIASAVGKGKVTYPGRLDVAHAWAYLPDLARVFERVAARRATLPPFTRLHFPGYTLTGEALCAALEQVAGRTLQRRSMPWPLLRALSPMVPILREICEIRYLWNVPHALDGQALEAVIGEISSTPLHDALATALHELGVLPRR